MDFHFELPDSMDNEKLVLCYLDNPVPLVYFNIYEKGDIWVKIQGCEKCPEKKRKACCAGCPLWTEKGCFYHLTPKGSHKPYNCVVSPDPSSVLGGCCIEFLCIRGGQKDQIRRCCDGPNIFVTRKEN